MSFLAEPNKDAMVVPLDGASTGPRMGFMEAFETAFDTQVRTMSVFGTETALREVEDEQNKRIRAAGLRPPDALNGSDSYYPVINSRRYTEAVTWLSGRRFDGQQEGDDEFLRRANTELDRLKAQRPDLGIKNYGELWEDVKKRARDAERRSAVLPTSTFGDIGDFVGGAVGGINPLTDPFNALTLGLGGAGKSVLTRLATQVAGQAAIEGINQITGVQQNRADLGLEHGAGNAFTQIGMSALGAAGFQVFGETLGAGLRKMRTGRWFHEPDAPAPTLRTEPQPAPVVHGEPAASARAIDFNVEMDRFMAGKLADTPLGRSRLAETRTTQDIDAAMRQLESYDGPQPFEIVPPRAGDTAIPKTVSSYKFDAPYQRAIDNLDTLEDMARKVDPETFNQLDKLRAQQAELRAQFDRTPIQEPTQMFDRPFNQPSLQAFREDVSARLNKVDSAMRDIAPLVNRAFEAAQGKWAKSGPSVDTMRWLQRLENRDFKFFDDAKIAEMAHGPQKFETPPRHLSIEERVPLTRANGPTSSKLPVGADAADRIAAAVADHFKAAEEGNAKFKTDAKKLADPEAPRDKVAIDLDAIQTRNTDASGAMHSKNAGDELRAEVRKALGEGAKVELVMPDHGKLKRVEIVSVDNLGMKDRDGNPWGTLPLFVDKSKVEVTPNTYVNLPDGSRLHLDDVKLHVPTEDGGTKNMTVREFLREFELDDNALQSVVTCSRSPHS